MDPAFCFPVGTPGEELLILWDVGTVGAGRTGLLRVHVWPHVLAPLWTPRYYLGYEQTVGLTVI